MQVLAEINTIQDLHAALRARREAIRCTFENLDDISGVADGYSAKLLTPEPMKNFGPVSFPAVPTALGTKVLLVVDEDAERRFVKSERWA